MRFVFFILSLLLAVSAAAQINTNQIRWPQPSCNTPGAPYNPKDDLCATTTTTGGLPTNNPQYTGTMQGPAAITNTTMSSVNGTLFVQAPPYNAKCDGSTDDQAAINQALADGLSQGKVVEFPQGVCLTSTLAWHGTPMRGKGKFSTTLRGKPGQDVIQGTNGNTYATFITDMTIQVDASVNAAATAAGGNNTFPTRVVGVKGDGSLTLWPSAATIAPGPVSISGSINAGSTTLTATGSYFQSTAPEFVVNAPVTVTGAGASGANLVTTIVSIIDNNNVTLAAAAATTVSNATVTWGNPAMVSPPWYLGNCGIAIPQPDATVGGFNTNAATFRDLQIQQYGTSNANHTCGFFIQSAPNDEHFERVDFMNLFMGYAETLPFTNAGTLFAWTPDTSSYKDVNFKFNQIAAIFLNGSHRSLNGFSIYSGVHPLALGFFWLGSPGGNPTGTISHYYDECWNNNTGEHSRFGAVAGGVAGINIDGGNLIQCGGPYVEWDANYSTVDAQISSLHIGGNNNAFKNTGICSGCVVDKGVNNSVDGSMNPTNGAVNASTKVYANRPREPLNKLDAGFLLSGNVLTPFTSGNDLLIPCEQLNFAFNYYGAPGPGCTSDPNGTEITKNYVRWPLSLSGWAMSSTSGGAGTGPYGKYLIIGDRLPKAKMTFFIVARCDAPCSQWTYVQSSGQPAVTPTFNYGTTWTVQTVNVDFSANAVGDTVAIGTNAMTGTGATYMDIAYMGFAPSPAFTNPIDINTSSTSPAGMYALHTNTTLTPTGAWTGSENDPLYVNETVNMDNATGTLAGIGGSYSYVHSTGNTATLSEIYASYDQVDLNGSAPVTLAYGLGAWAGNNGTAHVGTLIGSDSEATNNAGLADTAVGVHAQTNQQSTGTTTTAIAVRAQLGVDTGTVVNATGVNVNQPTDINGGVIQHLVGLNIADMAKGTIDNYALKTGLGRVLFGDYVNQVEPPLYTSQTAIASAATIAPTSVAFHVTGTTAISTITAPAGCTTASTMCQIIMIPDGLWTTTTTGNIALASTAVVGRTMTMTYDPTASKWYPSY